MPYADPETRRNKWNAWYHANKARVDERSKLARQRRGDAHRKVARLYIAQNRDRKLLSSTRARAKRKQIVCTLTLSWLRDQLKPMRCAVTGISLVWSDEKLSPFNPSLDRIDSVLGYTPENTRVVCWWFNALKNQHDDVTVKKLILAAADYVRSTQ